MQVEFAQEELPEEYAHPDDPEFTNSIDMTGLVEVQRRGVAPSLVSAREKWHGMFKRNSPLVAWKVGFRTFRRSHSGDTSFPEGFPTLQEFFDKCSNPEVFNWIVVIYKELIDEATAAGVYEPGDKTELDELKDHVLLLAGRHGHFTMQVRNPKYRDPTSAKPTHKPNEKIIKRGMFKPKVARPSDEETKREKEREAEATRLPPTIPKTFMMTHMQRTFLRRLVSDFGFFSSGAAADASAPFPKPVRVAVNLVKWIKTARAIGKASLLFGLLRFRSLPSSSASSSSSSSTACSSAPSPSLKREREADAEVDDERNQMSSTVLSVADLFVSAPRSMGAISAEEAWEMNHVGYIADFMSYEDYLESEREFASANDAWTMNKLFEARLCELRLPKRERRVL